MSVFTRSRTTTVLGGIALIGASALVLAGCSGGGGGSSETTPPTEERDLTLKIGTILPQTGTLAFLGPPEEAGVAYAVSQINEASADTGLTLDVEYGDSGDTDNKAYETEIPRLTQELTHRIEARVRACPEQWMWIHNRWKLRPDGTKLR